MPGRRPVRPPVMKYVSSYFSYSGEFGATIGAKAVPRLEDGPAPGAAPPLAPSPLPDLPFDFILDTGNTGRYPATLRPESDNPAEEKDTPTHPQPDDQRVDQHGESGGTVILPAGQDNIKVFERRGV